MVRKSGPGCLCVFDRKIEIQNARMIKRDEKRIVYVSDKEGGSGANYFFYT